MGGRTERAASNIANGLNERGYDVEIISCQKGLNPIYKVNENVKLRSLHGEKINNSIKRKINNLRNLFEIVKQDNIDILVTVDVELYIYAYPLQILHKCKVIAWEHFNYYKSYGKLEKMSQQLAAKHANELVVLGKNDLQNYKNNVKRLTKIDYIYNQLPFKSDQKTSLENKRVIAVGRLEDQKGFDLLLKAWSLVEKQNQEWKLDIFGDGSQESQLLKEIQKYRLKNVTIKSFTNNIKQEYLNSSLYVMSSRYEGFALVLLEAKECGLPIVSFDCKEGPSELIEDGINGYLVENFNIEQMADKILKLINNPELLKSFSENASRKLYNFNKEVVLDKWEKILSEL